MKINPAEYKILVVDDVQSNVLLLKALLGREGFGIVIAMNGTEDRKSTRLNSSHVT